MKSAAGAPQVVDERSAQVGDPGVPFWDLRSFVIAAQVVVLVMWLAAWEYIPRVKALQEHSKFLDPFFISSPSRSGRRAVDLMFGLHQQPSIWPYAWRTLEAATIGLVVGIVLGAISGLILSQFRFVSRVFHPYISALNAIPRIALIPAVVVIFGPTLQATVATSVLVVFFIAFFAAYEGGRSVPAHLLNNARLLGASKWDAMRRIRLPVVLSHVVTQLPMAITFSLLSVITGEVLIGYAGLGRFIVLASTTGDSGLTFAIAGYLALFGGVAVVIAQAVKKRVLHWQEGETWL